MRTIRIDRSGADAAITREPDPVVSSPAPDELWLARGVGVGDDGSRTSRSAVAWAAEDAVRRHAPLQVVRCWQMTTAPRPDTWQFGYVPPFSDWERAVLKEMERKWTQLRKQVPDLRLHAVHGAPGRVLVEASKHVDLVVVGSRGHGSLTELLIGSVADRVVREALSPVVVVRGAVRPAAPTG
jgi:nucleotide-binding universal stress UspA family protein